MAKFGTPEWQSIAETRMAKIRQVYEVTCTDCSHQIIYRGNTLFEAILAQANHNNGHRFDMAECCMYATGPVCKCGNVLV